MHWNKFWISHYNNLTDKIQQKRDEYVSNMEPLPIKDISTLRFEFNNNMHEEDIDRVTRCISCIPQFQEAKMNAFIGMELEEFLKTNNFKKLIKSILSIFRIQDKSISAYWDYTLIQEILNMLIFVSSQQYHPNYVANCG